MSSMPNPNEIVRYVIHVHCACSHQYNGETLHGFLLNSEYSGQDDDKRWTLALLHPRWCSSCLTERSLALDQVYEQRFHCIERCRRHAEEVREEIAYLRGVRDGQIQALSISLFKQTGENANDIQNFDDATDLMGGTEKTSYAKEKLRNDEDLDEVMDLVEGLEVAPRQTGDVEHAEDLSAIFQSTGIEVDEVTEEIEMFLVEEKAYNSGVVEGKQQQWEAEWNALVLELDMERRKELIKMALL